MNITKKIAIYISHRPKTILIFFCLLLFIHVVFNFCGFYWNDDINYAKYAALAGNNSYTASNVCDHFGLRWLPIFTTAFFYKFFGVNAITSALFSAISFVLTAFVVHAFIRRENFYIQVVTYILFFWNYSVIFYAHRLLPDAGFCAFNFIAYYFYHRQIFSTKKTTIKNTVLLSISLMLAVLTKETIIIVFPFWLILLLVDILKKRNYNFWILVFMFLSAFAFLYALYFKMTTGDWFYRYHLLQSDSLSAGHTYSQYPHIETLKRISYQLLRAFLLNGDMEYLLFAIAGVIYYKSIFKSENIKRLMFSFSILLLCSDFMSFTLTEYNPLWADPRHFLFIIPFAVIIGAYVLRAYITNPSRYILVLIAFICADIFLLFSNVRGTKYIYFLITAMLLVRWLTHILTRKNRYAWIYYASFAVIMSVNFLYDFIFPHYPYYEAQKEIVRKFFSAPQNNTIVYTGDMETAEMGDYFLSFKNKQVQFKNIDTCSQFSSINTRNYYLLVNGGYNPSFAGAADSLLREKSFALNFKELKKINSSSLYEVKNPAVLSKLKLYSTSDF
jgi:hypothetical protein